MKLLFVEREFPGVLGQIAGAMIGRGHSVRWCGETIGEGLPESARIPFVRPEPTAGRRPVLGEIEVDIKEAEAIYHACEGLASEGWVPDLIVSRSGGGASFVLREHWDSVPHLVNLSGIRSVHRGEKLRRADEKLTEQHRLQLRVGNAIPLLDSLYCTRGFTFSRVEHQRVPQQFGYKVEVLPAGVDTAVFHPEATASLPAALTGVEAPGRRVATYYRSRVNLVQGFDVFCQAAALLHGTHPDLFFVVIGAGEKAAQVLEKSVPRESFVVVKDLEPAVRAALFCKASLHIHSAHGQDYGQEFWQPMACGCPVLATDTALLREFIRHRENGLLWEPLSPTVLAREALRVLDRPEEFKNMAGAALSLARDGHAMDRAADLFEDLAGRVVAGPSQPPGFLNWIK